MVCGGPSLIGGLNKQVGRKFGLAVEQLAQILSAPIHIAESKSFSKSCQVYLIHYFSDSKLYIASPPYEKRKYFAPPLTTNMTIVCRNVIYMPVSQGHTCTPQALYLGESTKVRTFCRFLKKIEDLINGGPIKKGRGWKIFQKNRRGRLFGA